MAFGQEHLNQVVSGVLAEQLAFVFFFVRNAVFLHEGDEILRCVARERTATKLGVVAHKVFVGGAYIEISVGEVAATAAGDTDFFGDFVAVIEDENFQALLCSHTSTKQTGCTGTHNHNVERFHAVSLVGQTSQAGDGMHGCALRRFRDA